MPLDTTSQQALVAIAIALSIQTLLMIGFAIVMTVAWKRAHAMVDQRLSAFNAHMEDVANQTRVAVRTLERYGQEVSGVLQDAGNVARRVASVASAPRAWLMAGAASAVSRVISRWRATRHQYASAP